MNSYPISAAFPAESGRRQELAAFFLSAPPLSQQAGEARRRYLAHLRELGALEESDICRNAGSGRPLVAGEPAALVQALLTAAQKLAAGLGQPVLIFPAREADFRFFAEIHPRILCFGLTELLTTACCLSPKSPVWVRLQEQARRLTVSVIAAVPWDDQKSLHITQESARLHGGRLTLCDRTATFSIPRQEGPIEEDRLYRCPSAEALLADSLSPIWTGFYSRLVSIIKNSGSEPSASSSDEDASPSAAPTH